MPTIKTSEPSKAAPKPRATKAKAIPEPAVAPKPVEAGTPAPMATTTAPTVKPTPSKSRALKAAEQRASVARRASVMLKFVSDPTRLQVILFLAESERHVGALCEQLGQTQPAVSHHLALLRHGGIISPRRMGKNNFYSLSQHGVELARVVQLLLLHA